MRNAGRSGEVVSLRASSILQSLGSLQSTSASLSLLVTKEAEWGWFLHTAMHVRKWTPSC